MDLSIETRIQKWGNSLALRISGAMKDIPLFKENMPVTVEISQDGFTVKKINEPNTPLPFTEAELLESLDSSTAHNELVAPIQSNEWEAK